jgi:hypothetical protein
MDDNHLGYITNLEGKRKTIVTRYKSKKKTLSNTSILLDIYWNLNIEKPVSKKEKKIP